MKNNLNCPPIEASCGWFNPKTGEPAIRTRWVVKPADKFTQSKETLLNMIPKYE